MVTSHNKATSSRFWWGVWAALWF